MSKTLKKTLCTTLFTTALTAASFAPAHAYTINNDVIELAPLSPWAVSRAGAGTASPYCTMSKRYNKNIVMTLAESNAKNLTFAIDFQKDRFIPQIAYNIIIATDNGDSRSYELSPATEKAFIVRIKDDQDFYQNIWASETISVSVNTENYRFNTADFIGGRPYIASCLTSLTDQENKHQVTAKKKNGLETPKITSVPVTTTEQVKSRLAMAVPKVSPAIALNNAPTVQTEGFEIQRIEQAGLESVAKSEVDVEAIRRENRKLKAAIKKEREQYQARISSGAINASSSMELKQKVALLEKENAELLMALQDSPKLALSNKAVSMDEKFIGEMERLRTENSLLKISLQAAERAIGESKEVKRKNATLLKQLKEKSKRVEELEKALNTASAEIESYKTIKDEIVAAAEQNETLFKSYAAMGLSEQSAQTSANEEAELQSLKRKYDEQKREIQRMAEKMAAEREAFKAEKREIEDMLFDPSLTEKAQIDHLAKMERELQQARQTLASEQNAMPPSQKRSILPSPERIIRNDSLSMMDMSKEIQRLRDEIDRLRRVSAPPKAIEKAEYSQKRMVLASPKPKIEPAPAPVVEEVVLAPMEMDAPEPVIKVEMEPVPQEQEVVVDTPTLAPVVITEQAPVVMEQPQMAQMEVAEEISETIEPVMIKMEPEVEADSIEQTAKIEPQEDITPPSSTPVMADAPTEPSMTNPILMTAGFQALPDTYMLKTLQSSDKDLKVVGKDQGAVVWESKNVTGTVVRRLLQGNEFEASVNSMIGDLKRKCPAILDIEPLLLRKSKAGNLFAYDADCGSSKIGLIFYSKDGQTLSTVSYGAPAEAISDLEAKREKLIDALMDTMQG